MKVLESFRRIANVLTTCGVVAASGSLCIIVMAYCYEVVSRYFFNHPTLWASDLVAVLLFVSIFLMIPEVTRSSGHVSVTLLEDRISQRANDRLQAMIALLSALACFAVAWISGLENVRQFVHEITTVSVYPIPKWCLSTAVTYGFTLSGVHFLLTFLSPANTFDAKAGGFT
jgi:TRAP-type C4-dicarboxylate transport system permease small subunit